MKKIPELSSEKALDYREVLWYVILYETDIASVSGAFALLVHLVLVAVESLGGDLSGFLGLGLSGEGLRQLKLILGSMMTLKLYPACLRW